MSSSKLNNFRKRRFDCETSRSCNSKPVGLVKKIKKRKLHSYMPRENILRLKKSLDWITDLQCKKYFISVAEKAGMLPKKYLIELKKSLVTPEYACLISSDDDDDDDDDDGDDDDDDDDDDVMKCQILNGRKKPRYNPFNVPICPLSLPLSSYPRTSLKKQALPVWSGNSVHQKHRKRSLYQPDNLSCSKFEPKPQQSIRDRKNITPITNPPTDLDLLIYSKRKTVPEEKELETVTGISTGKQGAVVSQNSQTATTSRSCCDNTMLSEEMRMEEEKKCLQHVFDIYVKGSLYRTRRASAANITDVKEGHLKNERSEDIEQFLQEYYIPNIMARQAASSSKHSSEKTESKAESEDEEFKNLKIRVPKYKGVMKPNLIMCSPEWMAELQRVVNENTQERLEIEADYEQQLEKYRKEKEARRAFSATTGMAFSVLDVKKV